MSYLNDRVLDNGLSALDTEASHIYICSSEPTTYAQASSTYALGVKNFGAGSAFGSPAARSGGGRKVSSVAITDGSVTATGTAGFWAAVDATNSRLLAAKALSSTQSVTSGNTFTLASFDVEIPGPA